MAFEIKNSGKPRQVRGTTAYKYRNLYAFGVLAVSGLSWWLFEQLPSTKILNEKIKNGYWDRTPEENYRLEMIKKNLNPEIKNLKDRKDEIMSKKEDFIPIKI
ncbi:uncharacterized protein LOC113548247 [Rhopalosiphum maidis]|uniref:uncharacterized protein LOC113548247 n=1 Tax=Rhopalosiphum maidis TaxID=43146 RepID=UPI000EFE619C|nr:uncharacterized protein LOC113548247 [Rhopalosiphum maidis]XP_026804831.1 uncharacterized protein LOC113548247 [Rhopalosiphum maidis]